MLYQAGHIGISNMATKSGIYSAFITISSIAVITSCGSGGTTPNGDDDDDTNTIQDTDTDTDQDTDTGTDTDTDTDTGPIYDCELIPAWPLSNNDNLGQARGYHDLAFSHDGFIIGSDNGNQTIIKVDGNNNVQVFVPNIGMIQQMAWLPDDDGDGAPDALAAYSDQQSNVVRIAANGGVSNIASLSGPGYGLILGHDEYLYAAHGDISRIDHVTGAKQVLFNSPGNWDARVINWNPDKTKLYIGTLFGNGQIYALDIDPVTLDPISGANVFANNVGSGSYHDTLGVDVCGYLYVSDYSTSATYRVHPNGDQVQTLVDPPLNKYGHGMEWGNGVDVWDDFTIYQPKPYGGNGVISYDIGVPRMDHFDGTVINRP